MNKNFYLAKYLKIIGYIPNIIIGLLFFFIHIQSFSQSINNNNKRTFQNPLLKSGADPYVFYNNGFYYYTHTQGNKISIWKTKNMADLASADEKIIWTAPTELTNYSREIWAPEVLVVNGKWYAYFSADDGDNNHHRIFVLECNSDDPMTGNWSFKGQLNLPDNKWAIDADIFEYNAKWYVVWSGWENDMNGQQNIYIAELKDPVTTGEKRICISKPQYKWEKYGDLKPTDNPNHVNVNEGPQGLVHNHKLFIVYSASGCWTDTYALGLLTLRGGNPLETTNWIKSPEPVFQQSTENGVYATGHNSFFMSADNKESWILYHANSNPGEGCGKKRSPRMQQFYWSKSDQPIFGKPVSEKMTLKRPSD